MLNITIYNYNKITHKTKYNDTFFATNGLREKRTDRPEIGEVTAVRKSPETNSLNGDHDSAIFGHNEQHHHYRRKRQINRKPSDGKSIKQTNRHTNNPAHK